MLAVHALALSTREMRVLLAGVGDFVDQGTRIVADSGAEFASRDGWTIFDHVMTPRRCCESGVSGKASREAFGDSFRMENLGAATVIALLTGMGPAGDGLGLMK